MEKTTTLSPMMRHAIESFEHGLVHHLDGTEKSRKFAILHIDQAIELFIKEKCIQSGKSIYKSTGQTLNLHEGFKALSKLTSIPERPRLEELHDLRNTIQHKGLLPDQRTTSYYLLVAYKFAKRFLLDELNIPIEKAISPIHRSMMEAPERKEAPEEISDAFTEAKNQKEPISKISSAFTILEKIADHFATASLQGEKLNKSKTIRDAAIAFGTSEKDVRKALKTVFSIRKKAFSTDHIPSEQDAKSIIKAIRRIIEYVGFQIDK